MLRYFIIAPLLLAPMPAAAQPATPAISAPSSDAALDRFYAGRRNAPLWLQGGQLSPAGQLVLTRLRTSDIDGLAQGPALAARIDAGLAAPANMLALDRMLSSAWVALAQTLHGPVPGAVYADPSARPRPELADRTLLLAAEAPDLRAHVAATLRKSPIYEDLRTAVVADAASRGGRADPRLLANLERARVLPSRGRYVFVNPAAAELLMIDNGEVQDRMRVVVGTAHTPTAPMVSLISFATVNPYWNVAEDLARKLVAPRVVSQGLAYLKRANYEAIDKYGSDARIIPPSEINWKAVVAGTEQVKLRQRPGPYNSMGQVKFGFPNSYGIFLHDTPNKPQFAKSDRATSNGCIRLEDARRLARWLGPVPLTRGGVPDQAIRLPAPVPLYIAYITATPTGGGIQWARDVYAMDPSALASASR